MWALIGDIKKGKVCSFASFEEKKKIPRKRSLSWNLIHFVDQRKETALCRKYMPLKDLVQVGTVVAVEISVVVGLF